METQITEIAENKNTLSANSTTEAENIRDAAKEDAGFEKILKFVAPHYLINKEIVPLGTEYLAHATAWTKSWLKFVDGKVADRKLYRVARGEKPPEREELDEPDKIGADDDPWVLQYLVPFESMSNGEIVIFATKSIGGRRAVSDLCNSYAKRTLKGHNGQPVIQLATAEMPSKKYGKVPRPFFEIVGWDDAASDVATPERLAAAIPVQPGKAAANDLDDQIPF